MEGAVEELIKTAAMSVELTECRAPPLKAADTGAVDGATPKNSMLDDFLQTEVAGSANPCEPLTLDEWLQRLGQSRNLGELGAKLAWGYQQGYLIQLLGRAGPSQPAVSAKTGGLFPLPVWSPGQIKWQFCHGQLTSSPCWAAACWLKVACVALNWYYGFPNHREPTSQKKVHAAVKKDMMGKISRLLDGDRDYGITMEQVAEEIKLRRISYTGEEVSQPIPLTVDQIVGGLL